MRQAIWAVLLLEVKAEAETKIETIDSKIAELRRMRKALDALAESCSGVGPTSACPILDAIDNR